MTWHCVRSKPHKEEKARDHLRDQKFNVYWPRISEKKSLFPRYLFVEIDLDKQPWSCIRSTIGVQYLVGGNTPSPLPDSVINELQKREGPDGYIRTLRVGDKVRVGAFDGLFVGSEHDRTAVMLSFLGRDMRVLVDNDLVVAV